MKISGQTVMVTGGAGFIGSHLVDLLARDNRVLAVDDFSTGNRANLKQQDGNANVTIVEAGVTDKTRMTELARGVDVIYHLAVQCVRLSLRDPGLVHEVCATGTLNMLEAARINKARRFVYVSSSEVYGDTPESPIAETSPLQPTTVYAAAKLTGEYYARAYHKTHGLETTTVRPFNAYGPRSHFEGVYGEVIPRFVIRAMNGLPPVIFGDGRQTRDFTFVTETAEGILRASECDALVGDSVHFGFGRDIAIRDLAAEILNQTGRGDLQPVFADARPGDTPRLLADMTKAASVLGFRPRVGLSEGLRLYVDWLKKTHADVSGLLKKIETKNW